MIFFHRLLAFLTLSALLLPCLPKPTYADTTSHLLINQIQIAGENSANDEFIELYNPTDQDINLENFRLSKKTKSGSESNLLTKFQNITIKSHGYFLITHTNYDGSIKANTNYSTSGSIASDNTILLYSDQGKNILDLIGFGQTTIAEDSPAPNPEKGQSLRRINFQDTDNNLADLEIIQSPEPKNSQTSNQNSGQNPELIISSPEITQVQYKIGDIIINEFLPNPNTGEDEWIEFYNTTDKDIDLTNWTIEDNTSTPGGLTGVVATKQYSAIKSPKSLNNSGDIIILKDPTGQKIEEIEYGDFASSEKGDNNKGNNWPAPAKGNSLSKINDKFIDCSTPTKDAANQCQKQTQNQDSQETASETASAQDDARFIPGSIVINEIVSDPADDDKEWVELFNKSEMETELEGWTLEDGSENATNLEGKIGAFGENRYLVIEKNSLNNNGDMLILKDSKGNIIDRMTYGDWDDGSLSDNAPVAKDPNSLARQEDGYDTNDDRNDFVICSAPTKGIANVCKVDKDQLSAYSNTIIINELFPNPKGSDDGEWIELKNIGEKEINLEKWQIGDSSKKKYTFSKTTIKPNNFIIIGRKTSGIALNNTGQESVKLYYPNHEIADEITYFGPAEEDLSYALLNNDWFWTASQTQGSENIITEKNNPPNVSFDIPKSAQTNEEITFDASDSYDLDDDPLSYNWNFGDGTSSSEQTMTHSYSQEGKYEITLSLSDGTDSISKQKSITIKDAVSKTKSSSSKTSPTSKISASTKTSSKKTTKKTASNVKTQGIVIVEPGILGTQIFYLDGMQIYMYKKDFPDLKAGDLIGVSGEITESSGESRIKLSSKSDIQIIEKQKITPVPKKISAEEFGEENDAYLVSIAGQVIDKKGSNFTIDDGNGEIPVYIKKSTNINNNVKEGDNIEVAGIISNSKSGFQLLPRYQNDIKIINQNQALLNQPISIPPDQKRQTVINYLAITVGILTLGLLAWLVKNKIQKRKESYPVESVPEA